MKTCDQGSGTGRFRTAIERRLGLAFDESRQAFLADLQARRAAALGLTGEAYLGCLDGPAGRKELRLLAQELTVGETYFFRNAEQFHAFTQVAVPQQAQVAPAGLRVLSAGCASGEEAYTLAILLTEWSEQSGRPFEIRAVDVNPAVLERAGRGRYAPWSLRETRPEVRERWFEAQGRELTLCPRIRAAVRFEERNLIEDDPDLWRPGSWNVVFCRNVLMYFPPEQARAVVERITRALVPGGFLFLGHAETLRGVSRQFHLRHTHGTFYYQRMDGAAAASPTAPEPISDAAATLALEGAESWVEAIGRSSRRIEQLHRGQPASTPVAVPGGRMDGVFKLVREERFSEALAMIDALPDGGGDPDLLLLRATLLAHSGQLPEAEAGCRQLIAGGELSAGAHYVLALCREGLGDRSGAEANDRAAAYLDPAFAMPRLHLGLLARRAGDRPAARLELAQALVLLQLEDPSRVLLFGGGFTRDALVALCRAELSACGGAG